jgi:hypothetical protein
LTVNEPEPPLPVIIDVLPSSVPPAPPLRISIVPLGVVVPAGALAEGAVVDDDGEAVVDVPVSLAG